jgi:hypothetical protein
VWFVLAFTIHFLNSFDVDKLGPITNLISSVNKAYIQYKPFH